VVRLSDWLAQDDELVPFGPRAHAQAALREVTSDVAATSADQPPGSGFWDGDTSIHTAVPGPGIFGELDEPATERGRHRLPALAWHPRAPQLRSFDWFTRVRETVADLIARVSWPWAAAGAAVIVLAVVVLVIALGAGSPARSAQPVQAGFADQPQHTGLATLPALWAQDTPPRLTRRAKLAARTVGTAAGHAQLTRAQRQRPVLTGPAHASGTSTSTGTPPETTGASTTTPTETTPAPTETEPVQTTPSPAPPTGGGGGGGSTTGGGSSSSSNTKNTPAYGPTGSLGPGSSPDS
jgi:hypothetical protein